MSDKSVNDTDKTVMSAVGIYRLYDEYSIMFETIIKNQPIDDYERFSKRFDYLDKLFHHFKVMDGVSSLPHNSDMVYVCEPFSPYRGQDTLVSEVMFRKIKHVYPNDNAFKLFHESLRKDGVFSSEQWQESQVGPSSQYHIMANLLGAKFSDCLYSLSNSSTAEDMSFLAGFDGDEVIFKLFARLKKPNFDTLFNHLNDGLLDKLGYENFFLIYSLNFDTAASLKWYADVPVSDRKPKVLSR